MEERFIEMGKTGIKGIVLNDEFQREERGDRGKKTKYGLKIRVK